jgi:hypothetical protein
MMIGVLGSLAEYERELTRERTALKRAASRASGTRFGRPKKAQPRTEPVAAADNTPSAPQPTKPTQFSDPSVVATEHADWTHQPPTQLAPTGPAPPQQPAPPTTTASTALSRAAFVGVLIGVVCVSVSVVVERRGAGLAIGAVTGLVLIMAGVIAWISAARRRAQLAPTRPPPQTAGPPRRGFVG